VSYQSVVEINALAQQQPVPFSVGDTEIILIREGEEVRAFQAKCPHAGAPLAEGAICDGRLVCPWHKAAFQLQDGKMCEPLALANLQRYPVRIEQGKVLVSLQPQPAATAAADSDESSTCVILGNGAAGSAAIWTLRDAGFSGRIIRIEREAAAPYDRTALSKFVPAGNMAIDEVPALLTEEILAETELLQDDVVELQARAQTLILKSGQHVKFDRLLLATGGVPQSLDIPGRDLAGVHLLRSLNQAEALLNEVDARQQLVIIGNSFIGLEVAGALKTRGVDVTVVARQPLPFVTLFGEEIAQHFRKLHEDKGVTFISGEPEALEGSDAVTAVRLKGGETLATRLVLLATGSAPATAFIHDLALQKDGSLLTDSQLRTAENIWVAGDIATYPGAQGPQRIEHYRVAQQQGRTAALNMLGRAIDYDRVPFFWTAHYGTRYEYLGHAEEWDDYHLFGSLDDQQFIAFYCQQGNIAAVCSAGMYKLTAVLVETMQQPVTLEQGIALYKQYQQQ